MALMGWRALVLGALACMLAGCAAPPSQPPASSTSASPTTASLTSASPTSASSTGAPAGASPIKLGVLDDVTGPSANQGVLMRIDVDLVADEINSSGGINGHPLQVVYADPRNDPAQAVQLATQLVQQDGVDVLAGTILSPECQGVSALAAKLQIVYLPLLACATDQLTAKDCSRYTFRVYPVGNQTADPAAQYEVQHVGPNWGMIYPDYALGQSQVASNEAALGRAGGHLGVKIAVPLNEPNVTPYVTKIPTDGSISGLIVGQAGTDLARVVSVMQQFGITSKLQLVEGLGKESFSGVYPDGLNGALINGFRVSDGIPGNQDDLTYVQRFKAWAEKDADLSGPIGGVDKATPGPSNGYSGFVSMNALKLAMRSASFSGRADTDKLISALESLHIPQGPDAPAGPVIMNRDDHQGRMTAYLLRINGQTEDIVQTFPPEQLPQIGTCKVA